MPPVLLSRYVGLLAQYLANVARSYLDPFLGIFTGFFAYYLYETHPRTAVPPDQRLAVLVQWKLAKYQRQRAERLRAMDKAEGFTFPQGSK
jgi:Non-classical export protein 1